MSGFAFSRLALIANQIILFLNCHPSSLLGFDCKPGNKGALISKLQSMKQLEQGNKGAQYYGSEIVGDRFYIYLEYVYPGSIDKYVRDHCGAMTESVVRNFTQHILSGRAYLHGTKTIHRDIKGANLLVDGFGVVKLADFGMAKHEISSRGVRNLQHIHICFLSKCWSPAFH